MSAFRKAARVKLRGLGTALEPLGPMLIQIGGKPAHAITTHTEGQFAFANLCHDQPAMPARIRSRGYIKGSASVPTWSGIYDWLVE